MDDPMALIAGCCDDIATLVFPDATQRGRRETLAAALVDLSKAVVAQVEARISDGAVRRIG